MTTDSQEPSRTSTNATTTNNNANDSANTNTGAGTGAGTDADRNTSHVVSARRIGAEGLEVASGRSHRIEVVPMGTIHVRLMDWAAQDPASNLAYTILNVDGQNLTGETDDDGVLQHEDVTAGYYVLEVEDQRATVFTVSEAEDEPEVVRLVLRDPEDGDTDDEDLQLGPDEDVQDGGTGATQDGLGAGDGGTAAWRG